MLIGTGYTLEEVDTPTRYVVPDKQTAAIEWNKVTNKSFDNDLKKFNVTVTKSDRRTGLPQGDASLAGAKYGIYKAVSYTHLDVYKRQSPRLLKWGIISNGWCLTANTSESPNSEDGCILSDILIRDVPERYFLSAAAMRKILSNLSRDRKAKESTKQTE